jgi:hypothetical protein
VRGHSKDTELARTVLSQCVDQLAAILAEVRAQEPCLHGHRDPYFDQTIMLAHSHIDGVIRSLRGIVAHLLTRKKSGAFKAVDAIATPGNREHGDTRGDHYQIVEVYDLGRNCGRLDETRHAANAENVVDV